MQVPLSGPDITGRERELINQVLGTPYLSMGPKTNEDFEFPNSNFEIAIARYSGQALRYGLRPTLRSFGKLRTGTLRAGSG